MPLVLVDFPWHRPQDPRIPLGHASLLSAVRSDFPNDVRSVVVPVKVATAQPRRIADLILAQARGFASRDSDIAIGVYVWSEDVVQTLLRLLRGSGFTGRIILGGPQITYAGAGVDRLYPGADVFVRGFGEEALCALTGDPGRPVVKGVHYAGDIDQVEQARATLDGLPSPLLDGTIATPGKGFVRWETQRGCPFRCSFCQHREAGARHVRRAFSDERVNREIDLLCDAGVSKVAVLDPIFNTTTRATEILERFAARGFDGRLTLQCRAEWVESAFLDAAAKLDVTLEFGLQTIHRAEGNAVRRGNDVTRVSDVLQEVRARGIDHEVSLIFGLPNQTLRSFYESVRWCLERNVPVLKAFPLMLLRGTELDRTREKWGLVESKGHMPCVVSSNSFDRDDWRQMARASAALIRTEGRHPRRLEELLEIARDLAPDCSNWAPDSFGGES